MGNGITIRKILATKASGLVVVDKRLFYDTTSKEYYITLLDELRASGKIICNCYTSDIWSTYNEYEGSLNYEFNTLKYKNELKGYIIIKKYYSGISDTTLTEAFRNIKKLLFDTNYLNELELSGFFDNIKNLSDYDLRRLYSFREFLSFLNVDTFIPYIELLTSLRPPRSNVRNLPSYVSLLQFDNIISYFKENATTVALHRYYPIVIWWSLSTIIPMRPIELTILPKDCLDMKDGKYFITITRAKEDNDILNQQDIKSKQPVQITKDIYKLLETYRELASFDFERTYFLSYRLLAKSSNKFHQTHNDNILTRRQLTSLLHQFNEQIVIKEYSYVSVETLSSSELELNEIELPKLGDTRHLAFCSMMLQGLNPYTIATLGGHEDINSQIHYCSHLDSFVQSSVYIISKSLTFDMINNTDTFSHQSLRKANIFKFSALGDEFYTLPKVPGGRCTSNNIPYDCCNSECYFCTEHFVYDDNETMCLEVVNKRLEDEIKTKIEFIKSIVKRSQSQSNIESSLLEELKSNTTSLNTLIHKKAMIETYKLT